MYLVKNHDIDLYQYMYEDLRFNMQNFQVLGVYVDQRTMDIVVRRIDTASGWDTNIQVLVYDRITYKKQIVEIGASSTQEKGVRIGTDYVLEPSDHLAARLPVYTLPDAPEGIAVERSKFNEIFNTDIVVLPASMYAIGIKGGVIYTYSEKYQLYWEIVRSFRFIARVAWTYTRHRDTSFYFLIAANDGYLECTYHGRRTIPYKMGEQECKDFYLYPDMPTDVYPVFDKRGLVLAQSTHRGLPGSLGIVDRNYFYHNLYNSFRSWHRGIPFHKKVSKIVYGGNICDTKYNWFSRRDIELSPRAYFKSDAVPKKNILCGEYVSRHDMVQYKYIVDIDGISSTWCATAWKLNSGSVIFKPKSSWRQWFHDDFVPGLHYVELAEDFSDIQEKFAWCEAHQEECVAMVNRCKDLFQQIYSMHNAISYTRGVIDRLIDHV